MTQPPLHVPFTDAHVQAAFDQSAVAAAVREGVKPGTAKRQHFTPQLVLRKFLADDQQRLCQLEICTGKPHAIAIKEAASRNRFYSLTNEAGERDDTIEGLFGVIEDHAAPALLTLASSPQDLTPTQRVSVAYFAASQMMRTPSALQRISSIQRVQHTLFIARMIVDDAMFAEAYEAVREDGTPTDPDWLQQWMREALLDARINVTNEHVLGLQVMLGLLDDFAVLLYALPWTVIHAEDGAFVTSDSGMAIVDPGLDQGGRQTSPLGTAHATLLVPLSREHCLRIGPEARSRTAATVLSAATAAEVMGINLAVYGWAFRHIFADSQLTTAMVRRAAKRRPRDVIRPRPFVQHVLIERDPDDDRLAIGYRLRGQAAYIEADGQSLDYMIVRDDKHQARDALTALALGKARAQKRVGHKAVTSTDRVVTPDRITRSLS